MILSLMPNKKFLFGYWLAAQIIRYPMVLRYFYPVIKIPLEKMMVVMQEL